MIVNLGREVDITILKNYDYATKSVLHYLILILNLTFFKYILYFAMVNPVELNRCASYLEQWSDQIFAHKKRRRSWSVQFFAVLLKLLRIDPIFFY